MKKIYLFAAMAAMLAACSENDLTVEKQSPQAQQNAEQAIEFDAYVGRGLTRAGTDGVINNTSLGTAGFGVFGYYTNGESYTGSSRPDFFYNQKVSKPDTKWTYSPIKYWPNEFGSDAISDQVDKVTLFAYAPHVEVTPLTGLVTDVEKDLNITGMTRNNATGDPMVKYTSSMISNRSVDLCYGVAKENFYSSNSGVNHNTITAGEPYIDVVKPGTDANSKINFDFCHALAQLNVTIDAKVTDLISTPGDQLQSTRTRIWVRSITFEGITQTGALNLNSSKGSPNWYDVNGTSLITTGSLTVYDGRKDGREANEVANSEAPATLNPMLVQNKPYAFSGDDIATSINAGVTHETVNLFAKKDADGLVNQDNDDAPVFVIPTKEKMKVTIVYDVETVDGNLATVLSDGSTKGSTIENRIFKVIDGFGVIEAGHKYTLNLHLGMRSVDFEASVSEWATTQGDVYLPNNLMTFVAGSPGNNGEIILPSATETCDFLVSGFNASETITPVGTSCTAAAAGSADFGGVVTVNVTAIPENTTSEFNDNIASVAIGNGTSSTTVTIKKLARPLGLSALAYVAYDDNGTPADDTDDTPAKLTFTVNPTDLTTASAIKTAAATTGHFKVIKNGVDITTACTFTTATGTLEIELPSTGGVSGDKFEVYIKVNDCAEESASHTL